MHSVAKTKYLAVALAATMLALGAWFAGSQFVQAQDEGLPADLNTEFFADDENTGQANENVRLAQSSGVETESTTTTSDSCSYLSDDLRIDFNNDPAEVERLQSFLQAYGYEDLDVTGNFGVETLQAVRAFQIDNADDVLEPWGYDPAEATGYVYITTRQKINELFCDESLSVNDSQQTEINTFNQELDSFRADGASFDTPVYLSAYYEANPSANRSVALPELQDDREITDEDRLALRSDQDGNDILATSENVQENKSENNASTTEDGGGFFAGLFGSGSDEPDEPESSESSATGTPATNTAEVATASDDEVATSATSGIDQAAAGVYSGVNSIFGFLLSPTFLIVLLIVLILLLIATLFEDEEHNSAAQKSSESGAIGDWSDERSADETIQDVEATPAMEDKTDDSKKE